MSALVSLLTNPGTLTAGALLGSAMTAALLYAHVDRKKVERRRLKKHAEKLKAIELAAEAVDQARSIEPELPLGGSGGNEKRHEAPEERDAAAYTWGASEATLQRLVALSLSRGIPRSVVSGQFNINQGRVSELAEKYRNKNMYGHVSEPMFPPLDPPMARKFAIKMGRGLTLTNEDYHRAESAHFIPLPGGGEAVAFNDHIFELVTLAGGYLVRPASLLTPDICYWVSPDFEMITALDIDEPEELQDMAERVARGHE